MVTNFFTFSAFIIVAKSAANFDWAVTKTDLESKRELWLNTDITSYTYHWGVDCVCDPCYIGGKYITINSESVTDVIFDPEWLIDNDAPCISPLSTSEFKDITFYYDKAIEHAQRGIDANCPNMSTFKIGMDPTPNNICGGSVSFQYDEMLYYPKSISLHYGNFVSSDIGELWTFSCLTPLSDLTSIDLSLYTNHCPDCICTMDVDPYCCQDEVYDNLCIAVCEGCTEGGYKMFPDGLNGAEISCEEEYSEGCGSCEDEWDPMCCDGYAYGNGCHASCDGYSHRDCIRILDSEYDQCPCTDAEFLKFKNIIKYVAALDEDILFCNICFCNDENTETCVEKIDRLPQRKMDKFMQECYKLECDFEFVGWKDGWSNLTESNVCDCTLFECKDERIRAVYNESGHDLNNGENRIGVVIGSEFVVAFFWWIIMIECL